VISEGAMSAGFWMSMMVSPVLCFFVAATRRI